MQIRVEYEKRAEVRYISHLELMNTLRRAIRRADIPAGYSGGYNPRINLALSQPLSVGMTGRAEYFDLELERKIETEKFINKMRNSLPGAINPRQAKIIDDNCSSLQAVVDTAIYRIRMKFKGKINAEKVITEFMDLSVIKIKRERRNKEDRVLDLKPLIYAICPVTEGIWDFTVATGSRGNVRPGEPVTALAERYEQIKEVSPANIERRGLFIRKNDHLVTPLDDAVIGR
ncbi:MAG: TIGR03936 family radical SAM-associated protein [Halanaerobiaceae bacterium]